MPAQSAAMPYCFYSVVQKQVFAPQGGQVAPINVTFDAGERVPSPPTNFPLPLVRSPVPNFTFIGAET